MLLNTSASVMVYHFQQEEKYKYQNSHTQKAQSTRLAKKVDRIRDQRFRILLI